MTQLHKRFSGEQVAFLFHSYSQGLLSCQEVQDTLSIGKTRFFELWKQYQTDPDSFSIAYQRQPSRRISEEVERAIEKELLRDKELIENPEIPISTYNYSALRDRLRIQGIAVSVNTIIDRAKRLGCHKPRKKHKVHDREVLTSSAGALIQHDGSTHLWSPYTKEKWTLITSIDDYSRLLLFADFFPAETTWAHIQATKAVVETFGLPLRYYVDSLRVFRFVQGRDSFWRKHVLETDDVDTQWGKMMHLLGVDVIFALSPQAKGKIERPYRWMQDRIVRTCALEKITELGEARDVLREEVDRYNQYQVHSTTGEIPALRFARALSGGNSLFRPFSVPKPYSSPDDIFCLRETRITNGYGRISLFNHEIRVANVPLRQEVDVHLVPDPSRKTMQVRIWFQYALAHSVDLPLEGFRVHF
ncbi:MAG: hypothetical protein WBB65_09525 [Anaerolineales bacterium]